MVYEPGCTTPSDYGSRHPPAAKQYTKQEKEELGIEDKEEEMEFVVNEVEEISEAVTLPVRQHYTREDKELQELRKHIKLQKQPLSHSLRRYKECFTEISLHGQRDNEGRQIYHFQGGQTRYPCGSS